MLWSLLALALLSTALLTAASVRYAHGRGMLDDPGARRSHVQPTPRGGGIAIVVVWTASWVAAAAWSLLSDCEMWAPIAALAMVAGIGWLDDHRSIPARWRFAVHLLAALVLLSGWPFFNSTFALIWWPLLVFVLVGSINAWNFMDGINGIAASQAGLIAATLAVACAWAQAAAPMWLCAALAAACVGFLPFNLPRARIFLGDVGSGALGLAAALLLGWAWLVDALPLGAVLILPSAFALDAGLTLGSRVLRGRRWYRPHREHLYQWLVRSGRTHAGVTALYAGWTLACAMLALSGRNLPEGLWMLIAMVIYSGGAALWFAGRQRLLRRRSRT